MSYNKTFEVGKKDNERYNFHSIRSKTIIMSMVVFVIIAICVTMVQQTRGNSLVYAALIGIGFAFAGVLFFMAVNVILVKYKLYILYKSGKIKTFRQDITLDENGLHAKTERGSVDLLYDRIKGINETKHAFYISITTEHVYVFPKDQMNGENEIKEIRYVFKGNMKADKLNLLS